MKGLPVDSWDRPAALEAFARRSTRLFYPVLLIAAILGALGLSINALSHVSHSSQGAISISAEELLRGRSRCLADQQRPEVDYNLATRRLAKQSPVVKSKRAIWKNATLIDGDGKVTHHVTLIVRDGIIQKVLSASEPYRISPYDEIVEIAARYVTPGLIEMHSHAGVRELPQMWANEDVTELSSPVTPWARAIDGYKSHDIGIDLVAGGGVTTSLVLTGAQTIMSGEGYVFKMKRGDSPYQVLVDTSRESKGKRQRYLKMALGENIKKTWQGKSGGPYTRPGISYFFRHAMEQARNLKHRQDRWCQSLLTQRESQFPSEPYPESLEWQTLVDLIRGDIRLNVHCYETEDVFSLFDHSDEFGFNISTIHHALASHLMIDELKKRNVTVATFSDEWGFKLELYDTKFTELPKAIVDAGLPLVLTTDHPSTYGKLLMYVAQVAHHYGVSNELAIASLIAEPARALGLDNRIGFARPGYDADLVIWDKHPLRLGATPLQVMIDGNTIVKAPDSLWNETQPAQSQHCPPQQPQHVHDEQICFPGQQDLVVQGIKVDYFNEHNSDMEPVDWQEDNTATAVIRGGKLECIGKRECRLLAHKLVDEDQFPIMNVSNGFVTPGLTMVTKQYGMGEIPYEDSTMNGKNGGTDLEAPEFTKDALRFGEQHLDRSHRKGVTRLITPPMTDGFFHGVSACFRTGASSIIDDEAIHVEESALHFTIGHVGKRKFSLTHDIYTRLTDFHEEPSIPTVSKQIRLLRELLTTKKSLHPLYERASNGDLPVVVHTDNKDVIAQMIKLKRDSGAHLIIMGGAEAHLLAKELAEAQIPIILTSGWCHPFTWDERRCLVGPPLTQFGTADVLLNAGVLLGLGNWDYRQGHVEDALWEASWTFGARKPREALAMLSRNIDMMFRLDGSKKDVVIHEGDPLDFGSRIALILEAGAIKRCWPQVEPPRGS